jgi:hypothetical protein
LLLIMGGRLCNNGNNYWIICGPREPAMPQGRR